MSAALPAEKPVRLPTGVRRALLALGVVVLLVIPFASAPFANYQYSLVIMYSVVGVGLNLLTGYNGQISLGHSAFFAAGAYLSAVLIMNYDWHYLSVLPLAAAACFGLGYALGVPALRLKGLQLALVTVSLAVVTPAVIKRLDGVTRGQEGINVVTAEPPAWTGLARDQWVYLVCLAVAGVMFLIAWRLVQGRMGRALIAIRDHEAVAETLGVRASRTKTLTFAISAAYAGVGGVLYTYVVQFVGPESFGLVLAIAFISMIVVGGLATIGGAVVGAVFIQFVPTLTADINQSTAGVTYGAVLILFMFVMPTGVVGLVRRLAARLSFRRRSNAPAEPPARRDEPMSAAAP